MFVFHFPLMFVKNNKKRTFFFCREIFALCLNQRCLWIATKVQFILCSWISLFYFHSGRNPTTCGQKHSVDFWRPQGHAKNCRPFFFTRYSVLCKKICKKCLTHQNLITILTFAYLLFTLSFSALGLPTSCNDTRQ